MSEVAAQNLGAGFQDAEFASQVAAGAMLRRAREAEGLHIAALAVSLKVPVKKLEALEAGRLDELPDAVFARALASSICRTLKIDPAPVLAGLPLSGTPRLHSDAIGINTPFSPPGLNPRSSAWEQLSRPVVIAALALVLGALVLVLLPSVEVAPANPSLKPVASIEPEIVSPAAPVAALRSETQLAAPVPPVDVATANQVTLGGAKADAVVANAAAAPPPNLEPAISGGLVLLTAKSASWVEVIDANGTVQLRKTLSAGEAVGASGSLPLVVTVGRADATEVQVRGKSFDLAPITKSNVARFEVR